MYGRRQETFPETPSRFTIPHADRRRPPMLTTSDNATAKLVSQSVELVCANGLHCGADWPSGAESEHDATPRWRGLRGCGRMRLRPVHGIEKRRCRPG